MKATYNITSDKIKAWFDARLSTEDYKAMRSAGFIFCHGQKCFMAKWSVRAEDLVKELGIAEIEADDRPDDVEARVDRFSGYADKAEAAAQSSQTYLDERANTERRRNNAVNSIEKNLSAAEHWQQRIQGAIRHAARKEQPDVIARRIRGLEADLRRYKNKSTIHDEQPKCGQGPDEIYVGKGSGGYWAKRADADAIRASYAREIAHVTRRIEYETALLDAAGGCQEVLRPTRKVAVQPEGKAKAQDGKAFEVGGAAGFNPGYGKCAPENLRWRVIIGVNRSTVDVINVTTYIGKTEKSYSRSRTEAFGVATSLTAAEVRASKPELAEIFDAVQGIIARNKARAAAKIGAAVSAAVEVAVVA